MDIQVTSLDGKDAGSLSLKDEIFGLEPRVDILHRMVRYQGLKAMAGTHDTKGRAEIAYTGHKVGKQKGGGVARHGSRRAPQFRGGGRAFGPTPRSHAIDLPKKVRALALKHALSAKAKAALKRQRSVKAKLTITAVDAAGNRTVTTRTVKLSR